MKTRTWKWWLVALAVSSVCFFMGSKVVQPSKIEFSSTALSQVLPKVRGKKHQPQTYAVQLPYEGDSSLGSRFLIQGKMELSQPATRVRIIADDCLESLKIDHKPIPLMPISGRLCDFNYGAVFDLSPWIKPGQKHFFEVVFVNSGGGPHALKIEPVMQAQSLFLKHLFLTLALGVWVAVWLAGILFGSRATYGAALGIITLGIWLRLWMVLDFLPIEKSIYSDMLGYWDRAHQLVSGTFNLNHFSQPIGVSLIAAASLKLVGNFSILEWIHVLVSVATVLVAWRAFARVLTEKEGLFFLAILSLHFPWVSLGSFLMAETLFTFFLTWMFWFLFHPGFLEQKKVGFGAGLFFALAYLFKGTHAFFIPLLGAWALWARAWKKLSPFVIGLAIPLLVFSAWTWSKYGSPRVTANIGIINIVEGKCPPGKHIDSQGDWYWSPLFVQLGENRVTYWKAPFSDRAYFWKAGLKCISDNPWVLLSSFRYMYYLFDGNHLWPAPPPPVSSWVNAFNKAFALFAIPGVLLGFYAVYRPRSPYAHLRVQFLPVIGLLICVWIFKGELRYRVPFDAILLALAFLGWRRNHPYPVQSRDL